MPQHRIPLGQPFPLAWYARHRMVPMGPRGVYQVQSQPYWWAQPFLRARDRLMAAASPPARQK
jgi:hypothetical protein